MRRSLLGVVSAVAWLASGCSILAPQADDSRYFVLAPVVEPGRPADGPRLTLGVGPVVLPAYLARLQIVRRTGENQLALSSTGVWAEPLDRNVQGVLAANLARLLGNAEIVPYPSFTAAGIDRQISVAIFRFEADEHDTVILDARWTIQHPAEKASAGDAHDSHIVQQAADGSTASTVAAMSQAVGALSQQVAAALR